MKKTPRAMKYWIVISVFFLATFLIWYNGCKTNPLGPIVPTPVLTNLEPLYMQGEVIDEVSQTAISGVQITIGSDTYTTDEKGYFIVKKAYTPGKYSFSISKVDYEPTQRDITVRGDPNTSQIFKFALVKTEPAVAVNPTTGGTVSSSQPNYTVQVPPGAISQSISISITPVAGACIPKPPDPNQLVVNSVSLRPSGTQFTKPVTISMPLNLDKQLMKGKTLKVQLSQVNSSARESVDSIWYNIDSTVIYFNVTHFSQADVYLEANITTSTVTESKTTNIYANCDNYEVVSTTVQPSVVNTSSYPILYFETILGQSLNQLPPVTIAIQRKPELYPQYDYPPRLQLNYEVVYTRYFLSLENDPGKYVSVPIQINTVARIDGTCHDQGSVD